MTRLFLDTEFTNLLEPIKLISFALVPDKGPEMYVILRDGWSAADCSEFVRDTVLPRLGLHEHSPAATLPKQVLTRAEARDVLLKSLSAIHHEVSVCFDSGVDWTLMTELVGVWPNHVVASRFDGGMAAENYLAGAPELIHNALHDARALRAGWRYLEKDAGDKPV